MSQYFSSLDGLLSTGDYHTFLLDASGVLYDNQGLFDGVAHSVKSLQDIGDVFIVTNNANQSPSIISSKLEKQGVMIPPERIISSAHGLAYDRSINALIRSKSAYVFGTEASYPYVELAECNAIVDSFDQADVVCFMAYLSGRHEEEFDRLRSVLKQRPTLPVICCNPDRHIRLSDGSLKPVSGFYAEQLEELTGINVTWIGKPLSNFSGVVKQRLDSFNVPLDSGCIFFDDNPSNIRVMSEDLGISGCVVVDTGLSQGQSLDSPLMLSKLVYDK